MRYHRQVGYSFVWALVICCFFRAIKVLDSNDYNYLLSYDTLISDVTNVVVIASSTYAVLSSLRRPSVLPFLCLTVCGIFACVPNNFSLLSLLCLIWVWLFVWMETHFASQSTKFVPVEDKPVLSASSTCSICHNASPYEVCLDCDQKYRVERHRVRAQVFRAKQQGTEATLTLAEWLETINAFQGQCAYCQTSPYEVLEHYLPIALGGGTTQENCLPACRSCNARKSDKHPGLGRRVPGVKNFGTRGTKWQKPSPHKVTLK